MEPTLVIRRRTSAGEFGRYTLLRPVGRGGMGEVWLAQRDGASEVCVLKRLTESLSENPVALKRFQREAHVAAFLDHPGVAKTLDAGFVDDAFYIAMEHVAGVDLAEVLWELARRGAVMPVEIAVTIALDALDALAYVHAARGPDGAPLAIVHRDLAPKNLMLTFDGRVKVIDFGVARAALGDFETAHEVLVGTVDYFSPEQAFAQRVDHRSDLYALAAVLFELLAHEPLVPPLPVAEALAAITQKPARAPSSLRAEVPLALDRVVLRGLAKAPEDRYADARAFAGALAATGVDRVDQAIVGAWLERLFPERAAALRQPPRVASEATIAAFAPPPPPSRRPRPFALVAVLGALLGAVALLSFATFAQKTPPVAVLRDDVEPPAIETAPREPVAVGRAAGDASADAPDRARSGGATSEGDRTAPDRKRRGAANRRRLAAASVRRAASEDDPGTIAPAPERSPSDALVAALVARGLDLPDLAHQHHVPGATRVAAAKNRAARDAAGARALANLNQIDFSRWRLRRRVTELQAALEAAHDASHDSELIDLRVQLAGDGALAPKTYGKLCAALDRLESGGR